MDRKRIWIVWSFLLLVHLSAGARAMASEPAPIFGKTFSISPWYVHLSHHRFSAPGGGPATMGLTCLAPTGAIKDGIVTLNGRLIHLKSFFDGVESAGFQPVMLNEDNSMIVLLWGSPGSSLKLEVFRDASTNEAPQIIAFEAVPAAIQRGQSSLLSWRTEHADRCEIQPGIGSVDPSGLFAVSPTQTASYTLTAWGQGDPATSVVTVVIENGGPAAAPQSVVTSEDVPVAITLRGDDVDGDALSFQIESSPANGTLSGQPPDLVYHPNPNFTGSDSFRFSVSDGRAVSEPATVIIAVQATDDAPAAHAGPNQAVLVGEWVTLDGQLSSDPEGDALGFVVTHAQHGTVTIDRGKWLDAAVKSR